jgi:hypothetical protein
MKTRIYLQILVLSLSVLTGCFNNAREEPDSPYFPAVEKSQLPRLTDNIDAKNRLLSVSGDSLITYWNATLTLKSGVYLIAEEITLNPGTNLFETEGMIGRILNDRVELLLPRGYKFDSSAEEQFHRSGKSLILRGNALVAAGRTIIKASEIHLSWKES